MKLVILAIATSRAIFSAGLRCSKLAIFRATSSFSFSSLALLRLPNSTTIAIENLLKQEPSLLYRLLRYLKLAGAWVARRGSTAIRHAITLLGENEFRRWVSIFAVIAMSSGKPPELIHTALTRAYFCEDFSAPAGFHDKSATMFLMGLLSVSDALLDKPIKEVLHSLPIDPRSEVRSLRRRKPLSRSLRSPARS